MWPTKPDDGATAEGDEQVALSQLLELSKKAEEELMSKKKAVQEYASKLSGIKSRSKTKRLSLRKGVVAVPPQDASTQELPSQAIEVVQQQGGAVRIPKSGEAVLGKEEEEVTQKSRKNLQTLRKELEQNRLKFEHGLVDTKQFEEKVEQLRVEIQEKDQLIQVLQQGLESATTSSTKSKPVEQQEKQPSHQEMYAQMMYKDKKIVELTSKIDQLELSILDLKENLKEKDSVIDARTRAITLMSEDLSRRGETTVNTLAETREQMQLMQKNFIIIEAQLKDEIEQLNKQLQAKNARLHQMEENIQELESDRYNLSTRLTELQATNIKLVAYNEGLRAQRREKGEDGQVEELLQQLDDTNKQMIKMKAQHTNKMKQLTKQLDNMRKVTDANGEILRLQQRVAELEEDKGNLQLHLVDFDELKASEERFKLHIQELEEKVQQQSRDLDIHLHTISKLEDEKLSLMSGVKEEKEYSNSLKEELNGLQNLIGEIKNEKVAAEMKTIELEEQLDILIRQKEELFQENMELKQQLDTIITEKSLLKEHSGLLAQEREDFERQVNILLQEKAELQLELTSLQGSGLLAEADTNRSFQMLSSKEGEEEKWKRISMTDEAPAEKHVKDSSNLELSLKTLEAELEELRKTVAEQENIITDLNSKLESREEDLEMQQELISNLEQLGREVGVHGEGDENANTVSKLVKEVQEMAGDLEEWKRRCSEVQDRLKCLEHERDAMEKRLEEVTNENSLLDSQLRLQKEVSEEAVSRLNDQSKVIAAKDEIIAHLEALIEENKQTLTLKENELLEASIKLSKLHEDCCQKHEELLQITQNANIQAEKLNKIISDQNLVIEDLSRKCQYIDDSKLENVNSELVQTLDNRLEEVQELKRDLELAHEALRAKDGELFAASQEMERIVSELALKDEAFQKTEEKLKEQTAKLKKLAVNLKAKAIVVREQEKKETELNSALQEKEKTIFELTGELNTLRREILEQAEVIDAKSKQLVEQETSLRSEESKIMGLIEQIRLQDIKILSLEEEKTALALKSESSATSAKELEAALRNHVTDLENEVSNMQMNLWNRTEEIVKLNEEKENLKLKTEELTMTLGEKDNELKAKLQCLEMLIVSKDMELSALQEQLAIREQHQQAWSALGAKLQEREAYIESLEQDLTRSRERQSHLEESFSNFEERRRSLESKYEALGERLQESDRIKIEKEENEDFLEQRLSALITSEENLHKKLDSLLASNDELSQKITELTFEKEELKQSFAESENTVKMANKELERLSSFESAYNQSLDKMHRLEQESTQSMIDLERSLKEKLLNSQHFIESLELDLKNVSNQVQLLETEKHALMEHCEKLNDLKCTLEEEMEEMAQKNITNKTKIEELQEELNLKQLEIENLSIKSKQDTAELKTKVSALEYEIKAERERSSSELMEVLPSAAKLNSESQIFDLTSQVSYLTSVLAQKDSELQSYQSRLLQLQFGGAGSSEEMICSELEQPFSKKLSEIGINCQLQECFAHQDEDLEELDCIIANGGFKLSNLKSKLLSLCPKIQNHLSEISDKQISEKRQNEDSSQQLDITTLCQQLQFIFAEFDCCLSILLSEYDDLYAELVKQTAAFEVEYAISLALDHVVQLEKGKHENGTTIRSVPSHTVRFEVDQELEGKLNALKKELLEVTAERNSAFAKVNELLVDSSSTLVQELEEKLFELSKELESIKEERDVAIMRIEDLTSEYQQSQELEMVLHDLHSEKDAYNTRIEELTSDQVLVKELQTKLNVLEIEKEKLLEDLRISQVRSGKMLSKLKDFKLKNESLMRENQNLVSKKNDLSGLDSTIEELLKSRISSLEKELQECTNERDMARAEKDTLLKRIDTLTAANERFVEMKEQQDSDVLMFKRRNKELMNEIESLQWKLTELSEVGAVGGPDETTESFLAWEEFSEATGNVVVQQNRMFETGAVGNESETTIPLSAWEELQDQIASLVADNEQLQNVLEDQRNLRIDAEATIRKLEKEMAAKVDYEEIIMALRKELAELEDSQRTSSEDQANLFQQEEGIVDTLREENVKLREKLHELEQKSISSERQGIDYEDIVIALQKQIDVLRAENMTLRESYEALYREADQLRSSVGADGTLKSNYEYLQFAHERLGMEMSTLQESYHTLEREYEKARADLEVSSARNDAIINEYNKQLNDLKNSKLQLEEEQQTILNEHKSLSSDFQDLVLRCNELIHRFGILKSDYEPIEQKLFAMQEKYGLRNVVQTEQLVQSEQQVYFHPVFEEPKRTSTVATMTEQESSISDLLEGKQMTIAELHDEVKKKTAEMDVLREMISSEQQERADTENELNYMISCLQSELEKSKEDQQKGDKEKMLLKEQEVHRLTVELENNRELGDKLKNEIQCLTSQLNQREQLDVELKAVQESLLQTVSAKDSEIQSLQMRLKGKDREITEILRIKDDDIENLKLQILEHERQVEELLLVKEEDLQNLRVQIMELERRSQETISIKDEDIYNLQLQLTEKDKKIHELSQMLEDVTKQLEETQELLTTREDELKQLTQTESAETLELDKLERTEELRKEELEQLEATEPNQKQSELDLALYMLHQRDVRCDELTLEVMQLLEERDTLQLRLSSSIKIIEELRAKINKTTSTTSSPVRVPVSLFTSSSSESSRGGESFDQILIPIEPQPITPQNVVEEPKEDLQELANKLSQLHKIDYRRDVTVHEERQQRHNEQIQLLQQRGAGIVVESNYTVSRDVQSPSTVIFNWIWGRSTPRVVHI